MVETIFLRGLEFAELFLEDEKSVELHHWQA